MFASYKNTRSLISIVLLALLAACSSRHLLTVDVNQKADFHGTLQYELFYGAPGFGEDTANDEKEPSYILHLDNPFLFRDSILAEDYGVSVDSCTYDTVSTIQIRIDEQSNPYAGELKSRVGNKITLTCTLYGAYNGHHHAPALTEKVFGIK